MEAASLALDVNLLDRLFACTSIVVHLFLDIDILVQRCCVLLLLEVLARRWAVTWLSGRLLDNLHAFLLLLVDLVDVDP